MIQFFVSDPEFLWFFFIISDIVNLLTYSQDKIQNSESFLIIIYLLNIRLPDTVHYIEYIGIEHKELRSGDEPGLLCSMLLMDKFVKLLLVKRWVCSISVVLWVKMCPHQIVFWRPHSQYPL